MTKIIDRRAGSPDRAAAPADGELQEQAQDTSSRAERRRAGREKDRAPRRTAGEGLADFFVDENAHLQLRRGQALSLLGMFAEHIVEHYSLWGTCKRLAHRLYAGLRYGVWTRRPTLFEVALHIHRMNQRAHADSIRQQSAKERA